MLTISVDTTFIPTETAPPRVTPLPTVADTPEVSSSGTLTGSPTETSSDTVATDVPDCSTDATFAAPTVASVADVLVVAQTVAPVAAVTVAPSPGTFANLCERRATNAWAGITQRPVATFPPAAVQLDPTVNPLNNYEDMLGQPSYLNGGIVRRSVILI